MDSSDVQTANARLWAAHPELGRRQLTMDPSDAALRAEWKHYYQQAASRPPPPAAMAIPVVAPAPPPVTVVAKCPLTPPTPIATSDCKEIKKHVQEGDIVLRGERGNSESDFIAKVSKCEFSHAGIVVRDAKGDLVVVDAYPGRGPNGTNAVGANSVDSFFCDHKATQGIVTRPKDCAASKKAAEWALLQTQDPDYQFALFDPWNADPKSLYCSDFVFQSFQNAGVDLVPAKMDFMDPANKKNTLEAARSFDWKANALSDAKLEKELLKKTGGSTEYITPCQVAKNSSTDTAVNFDTSLPTSGSSGSKTKSP